MDILHRLPLPEPYCSSGPSDLPQSHSKLWNSIWNSNLKLILKVHGSFGDTRANKRPGSGTMGNAPFAFHFGEKNTDLQVQITEFLKYTQLVYTDPAAPAD